MSGARPSRFLSETIGLFAPSEVRELLKITEGKRIISLAGGLPDPSLFPKEHLAEIVERVVLEEGESSLQYSPTPGVTEFRKELVRFLEGQRVAVRPGDYLIVTTGSQEALYLLAKATIDPGDVVFIEEPGYLAAMNTFKAMKARLVGIPLDDEGMRTDVLRERVREAAREGRRLKIIYTNPTCQNPSGVTMSMERRKELLEVASEYDLLVIEDDPYSYFTFEEREFSHLKAMDREGRVVYMGTLSKILVPGLRLGWIVGDQAIMGAVELIKQIVDLHSSTLSQYIALHALRRGIVADVIRRARSLYKSKRDAMLGALEDHMSGIARWTRPIGGFFIFAYLEEGIDAKKMLLKAVERGVAYVPGEAFFVDRSLKNTMRLSFSYETPENISKGIGIIARVAREEMGL